MDKENSNKSHSREVVKTILSALLSFIKTIKVGKSGSEKYYSLLLSNKRSIRLGAQYSIISKKLRQVDFLKVSMIYKWKNESVSKNLAIYETVRKTARFWFTMLYLNWDFWNPWRTFLFFLDIYMKVREKRPLMKRSSCWI